MTNPKDQDVVEKMCAPFDARIDEIYVATRLALTDEPETVLQAKRVEAKQRVRILMRQSLAILTKPENISDSALEAAATEWFDFPKIQNDELREKLRRTIAASITAAIGD